MEPDFSKYNLALVVNGGIVHNSNGSGLRPLFEISGILKDLNYILYDKIIGLAGAKLIVYYKKITELKTSVISKKALSYLNENKIIVSYKTVVQNILKKDKSGVCPGELKAEKMSPEEYFKYLKNIYKQW